jgi:molecular chaperone GrpE
MPDDPPPTDAGGTGEGGGTPLTSAAVETLLADFRDWLTPLTRPTAAEAPPVSDGPEVDLFTLVGQFTALRHEVNLQTRAARSQADQAAEALRQLGTAVEELRAARADAPDPAEEALRPLLKALVDVYDALSLAGREVERAAVAFGEDGEPISVLDPPADVATRPTGVLARWFGPAADDAASRWKEYAIALRAALEAEQARRAGVRRAQEVVASLAAGYRMGLRRLERALAQAGVEPVAAAGRSFDPELMEVAEVAVGTDRPAGEVLEEVRRGWRWRGRVFRFAQVRVAGG